MKKVNTDSASSSHTKTENSQPWLKTSSATLLFVLTLSASTPCTCDDDRNTELSIDTEKPQKPLVSI